MQSHNLQYTSISRLKLDKVCLFLLATFWATGCVSHIKPYKPKVRKYERPIALVDNKGDVKRNAADSENITGSVFDSNSIASRLMTDPRAQQVNDLVIIQIEERASAQRDTSTEVGRDDSYSSQITSFLGLLKQFEKDNPNFDGSAAINFLHQSSFKGEGTTTRNDNLEATVPAMVRKVYPNRSMFVEGHRVVLVNNEEHHFYISGVIRPEDIDGTGIVSSSKMADAQIEFVGRGDLTSGTSKGWFSRALDFIWPF
ncbi:MAG: flagellar biosynthesis protein FlgH [Myxococcales bacterium]|nr:flagellar biosynthesis protein FlgH [Myxococcales bacterium]